MEQDKDRGREIEYVTIPYSNYSQSIKDGWFVSSSTLTKYSTKNVKSFTPLFRGDSEIWAR